MLNSLVLRKMFGVPSFKSFEDLSLVCAALVHLHKFFDGIKGVVHRHTVLHNLFLSLTAQFKLVELFLDSLNCWIVVNLTNCYRLRDQSGKLLACFTEKFEALFVGLKFCFYLCVGCNRHFNLPVVIKQTLFVLLVHSS